MATPTLNIKINRNAKMKKLIIFVLLFLSISAYSQETTTKDLRYFWPLAHEKALTSTFGEYRTGHFHAGLDLKTWGEPGYEVYAVDDGYIWQVETSTYGYGKVIYLKLNDGNLIVYGHLMEFCDKIRERVIAEQERLEHYHIKLTFEKNDLPVKKGELIAYSGETGAGAPHLHFEMRDSLNRPINPLNHGFSVDDTIPPVLKQLSITPIGYISTINGKHPTKIMDCIQNENGYYITEIPQICGKFYFGISTRDYTQKARNPLGIYKADIFWDGQ